MATQYNHNAAQKAVVARGFAPNTTVKAVNNLWAQKSDSSPGFTFFTKVLSKNPGTIANMLTMAAKAGFSAKMAINHMAYLYTWPPGGALLLGGKAYVHVTSPERKVAKPVSKAPATKQASKRKAPAQAPSQPVAA